ncbi:hypothetical protein KP509_1Z182300 [Ceratopteris richardii]|nr:hypothetical protein KP509_1Z182300 [Ceratopteris richardii]
MFRDMPGAVGRSDKSQKQFSGIHSHLRRLNKPAVMSIKSPDGDTIDCVHISLQPALDHPKLRNHKIKMEVPPLPKGLGINRKISPFGFSDANPDLKIQLWHTHGVGRCPAGTIPIRRTTEADLLRASKFVNYGRKRRKVFRPAPTELHVHNKLNEDGHQHAIAYVEGDKFYGATAIMNVWNPTTQVPNEFSLSQIWLLAGPFEGDLNSVEAGWQVSPELYGDNNTRLFTYWTSDAYQETGCYNLLCSGFVQINDRIALGATISPVSTYNGEQFDIEILIWKDPRGGDWWMSFGQGCILGYWPSSLFSYLSDSATMVEWGGEVVNSRPGGHHTATHMGSGHFPWEGFGKASYFSNVQIVNAANNLIQPPPTIHTFAEDAACYDVQEGYNTDWGYYFYYGGPGSSHSCP